jgi:hypothetical protein
MDGMKLDEEYRQKNGLGPAEPEPNLQPKSANLERVTFDAPAANPKDALAPPLAPTPVATPNAESQGIGFIDKVLAENNSPHTKIKRAKKPKPPKPSKTPNPPKLKPVIQPKSTSPPLTSSQPKATKKPSFLARHKNPSPKAKTQPKPPTRPVPTVTQKPLKRSRSDRARRSDVAQQLISVGKAAAFVALAVFSLYNFIEVQRLNELLDTEAGQQSQNEAKNQELINTISNFRLLPDSQYEVYTVKDKTKLVNDPVFQYAENGDKVVVYPDDSLTIVYRESDQKIVSESNNSKLTEN